jgi:hypothetical protein
MFNLEQSIADWRQQMLVAGIKAPVPLDELEIHLREEIERHIKSGSDEQRAFEIAVQQIGPHQVLQMEFAKNTCSPWEIGDGRTSITHHILGVLWLTQSIWFFTRYATSPAAVAIILYFPHYWQIFTVCLTFLAMVGIIGSFYLFRGAKFGVNVIQIIAALEFSLCTIEYATDDKSFGDLNYWFGIFSVFSFITICLLRSPKYIKPKLAVK